MTKPYKYKIPIKERKNKFTVKMKQSKEQPKKTILKAEVISVEFLRKEKRNAEKGR